MEFLILIAAQYIFNGLAILRIANTNTNFYQEVGRPLPFSSGIKEIRFGFGYVMPFRFIGKVDIVAGLLCTLDAFAIWTFLLYLVDGILFDVPFIPIHS